MKRISENQSNIYNIELNNGMTPGYTLTRNSNIKVNIDKNEVNKHLEVSKILTKIIYKTEELTKGVKRVITQDDVTRAFQNVEKQVPLDIKINNIKVRAYIKANEKTGGVEIKNYHFDVQE